MHQCEMLIPSYTPPSVDDCLLSLMTCELDRDFYRVGLLTAK